MVTLIGDSGDNILIGTNQNDTIQGLDGNDYLDGGNGNDTLLGGSGNNQLIGGNGNDRLTGGSGRDTLIGGSGKDDLSGGNGDDILQGTSVATAGEQDVLTGGGGSDTFVLGSYFGVFYDDGNITTSGKSDLAAIWDFNSSNDVIQLGGFKSNYILKEVPGGPAFPTSTQIYWDKPGTEPDELIGMIVGATGLDLNAAYFRFQSVPAVELSAVAAGTGGFAINGEAAYDSSGWSVSSAGDVNGDGLDDLIVGADGADPNGNSNAGKSYVVFGKADGSAVNLSAVAAGIGGFAINGEATDDWSGISVSSAGDVNSDGLDDLIVGAYRADPNGNSNAGKSYVVFGKADGGAVNLSAVASGIGGFAINGEAAGDISGGSVSSAGDVNGDGFADLIVGAKDADPNGNSDAGKSYVIFGGNFTGSVTQQGTTGNDFLTGSALADHIVGGLGNDTLIGNGGKDVFYGAAGDDVIAISDTNFNRIDGGSGIDTLQMNGSNLALDLTKIANNRISGIERIDITGSGNNGLALQKQDVLALSDQTNQLIVMGNTGDILVSGGQGWIATGIASLDNNLYIEYTAGGASLLVDSDITHMIS